MDASALFRLVQGAVAALEALNPEAEIPASESGRLQDVVAELKSVLPGHLMFPMFEDAIARLTAGEPVRAIDAAYPLRPLRESVRLMVPDERDEEARQLRKWIERFVGPCLTMATETGVYIKLDTPNERRKLEAGLFIAKIRHSDVTESSEPLAVQWAEFDPEYFHGGGVLAIALDDVTSAIRAVKRFLGGMPE